MMNDAVSPWQLSALEDDPRPAMFAARAEGRAFALATIARAQGGPRRPGTVMVVTETASSGFLSGGCIEGDVERHARAVLLDGLPRRLRYGAGSPFIDLRLTCGGWIEVLVERIFPDDPALAELFTASAERRPIWWQSDGADRQCADAPFPDAQSEDQARIAFTPCQRLIVIGGGAYALAIAAAGVALGWAVTLVDPMGREVAPPLALDYRRDAVGSALTALRPDRWTAVAVASHDDSIDDPAVVSALTLDAGYVGILGARSKLPDRMARWRVAGCAPESLARLHAPIGLAIGASSPREVGLAVVAQILAERDRS